MHNVYKNVKWYIPRKNCNVLIAFDDIIADIPNNKNFNPIVSELFIKGRKLIICLVFSKQSYFPVPENIRLNSTYNFVMKVQNKRELQKIIFNHSSGIGSIIISKN